MSYRNGPKIASNGLILHLDAANTKSYNSGSSSWNDLSKNGNNGTLTNTPIFSTAANGSFNFNGSSQKIDCTNNTSLQITVGTISAWFLPYGASNTGYRGIIAKQNAWGLFLLDNVFIAYDWGNGAARSTGITPSSGLWHYGTMTFTETSGTPSNNAILYLDGVPVLTTTVKNSSQGVTVQVAEANAGQYFSGNIAMASVYNRVLSASEVLQNFNATKKRFGL